VFTGIITDVGRLRDLEVRAGRDTRLEIETAYPSSSIELGASIACNGCCLTVVEKGSQDTRHWFAVEVSAETLSRTTLGDWTPGWDINLERSLKIGDELGGHLVFGHVDGIGEIVAINDVEGSRRFRIAMPRALARFVAEKGSIAVNGISLTVNGVDTSAFEVNIIPHTQQVTGLRSARAGDRVNLEIDMLARYVARLKETEQ